MPNIHARQIAWLIRHHEACVQAIQNSRGIPLADLATLEPIDPPTVRVLLDDRFETLRPDLAWFVQFGPRSPRSLLLVDAVHRFDPSRIGSWPRLRAGVRLQSRCPTWMLVHASHPKVVAAIAAGFVHQRELMPVVMGPELHRPDPGPRFPRPRLLVP
jgi:hypothetical protein